MSVIISFVETRDGEVRPVSGEVVTAARRLADGLGAEVHALVLGTPGVGEEAKRLERYGADRVRAGESDALSAYSPDGYARAVASVVEGLDCAAILFPASALGKDLAPRVAARLGSDYAAECTALTVEDGRVAATRPQYAGKVSARVRFTEGIPVLSVRPNVFQPEESPREAEVDTFDPEVSEDSLRAVVREVIAGDRTRLDVTEASTVVSGGRGLREPENFELIEQLADALGAAAVGASRAVVDAGWRPHGEQVGQTGKTVSPTLYFAIGISGAIQHLAGMRTSRCIVAINKDPDAPIFKVADYGIVGDLFEIVPALTEQIRSSR